MVNGEANYIRPPPVRRDVVTGPEQSKKPDGAFASRASKFACRWLDAHFRIFLTLLTAQPALLPCVRELSPSVPRSREAARS